MGGSRHRRFILLADGKGSAIMLSHDDLGRYEKWIGRSALEIRGLVIDVGGWTTVFTGKLPKWAHRLRNFFNEPPRKLYRIYEAEAKRIIKKAEIATSPSTGPLPRARPPATYTGSGIGHRMVKPWRVTGSNSPRRGRDSIRRKTSTSSCQL